MSDLIDYTKLDYNALALSGARFLIAEELEIATVYLNLIKEYEIVEELLLVNDLDSIDPHSQTISQLLLSIESLSKTIFNDKLAETIQSYRDAQIVISGMTRQEKADYTKNLFGRSLNSRDLGDLVVKDSGKLIEYNRDPNKPPFYYDLFDDSDDIFKKIREIEVSNTVKNIDSITTKLLNVMRFHEQEASTIKKSIEYDFNYIGQFNPLKADYRSKFNRKDEIVKDTGMIITRPYEVAISQTRYPSPFKTNRPYIYKGYVTNPVNIIEKTSPDAPPLDREFVFNTTGYWPFPRFYRLDYFNTDPNQ